MAVLELRVKWWWNTGPRGYARGVVDVQGPATRTGLAWTLDTCPECHGTDYHAGHGCEGYPIEMCDEMCPVDVMCDNRWHDKYGYRFTNIELAKRNGLF